MVEEEGKCGGESADRISAPLKIHRYSNEA